MRKANYTRAQLRICKTAMIRSMDYLQRLSSLIHGHPKNPINNPRVITVDRCLVTMFTMTQAVD